MTAPAVPAPPVVPIWTAAAQRPIGRVVHRDEARDADFDDVGPHFLAIHVDDPRHAFADPQHLQWQLARDVGEHGGLVGHGAADAASGDADAHDVGQAQDSVGVQRRSAHAGGKLWSRSVEDRNDLGAIHNQGRRLSNHGGSRREWIVTTYAALSFRSLPAMYRIAHRQL